MTSSSAIETLIKNVRSQRVILDNDLAKIYGVSTKRLNEQVKRNRQRFPYDFMFRLTIKEKAEVVTNCDHLTKEVLRLRSQFATLKKRRGEHRKYLPYAFTEYGAFMAANVLNSPQAISMSVYVVRAFVRMREAVAFNHLLEKRLLSIEKNLMEHDLALRELFIKIKPLLLPSPEKPKRRIGFYRWLQNATTLQRGHRNSR